MNPTISKQIDIKFIDLGRQYQRYKNEIDRHMKRVIDHAQFIMGPEVGELEKRLALFTNTRFSISCASGTDALLLSLMAYDLKPGDEIITIPFSFFATAEAIVLLKAKPVFVDIKENTFNIDPDKIRLAITPKTRGIIAVDLFGQCADYDAINAIAKEYDLFVIEDAAQSLGAQYKGQSACSLTQVGCTSFFPAKPLGCFGDGGMIMTDDDFLARKIQSLRVHGSGNDKNDNIQVGLNSRLDTLQAAVLLAKLKYFRSEISLRAEKAHYYTEHLSDKVIKPFVFDHNLSVYSQYCIRVRDRDGLQKHLKEYNIPTAIHYKKGLHQQKALEHLNYGEGDFPVTERVCGDILALPMHPFLTQDEQDYIIHTVNQFLKH